MVTDNFWPFLFHLLSDEAKGWDASPRLAMVAPYLTSLIQKSPSSFEQRTLSVIRDFYATHGVAPSLTAYLTEASSGATPADSSDFQEFSSKIQMGMLVRLDTSDMGYLLQKYEEGRDLFIFRDVYQTFLEMQNKPIKVNGKEIFGFDTGLKYAQAKINALGYTGGNNNVRCSSESIDIPIQVYADEQLRRQRTPPFFTGMPTIDNAVGGFIPGDLVAMLGATAHGKSTIVLNWVYNALLEGRNGVLYSLEMSENSIMARLYAIHSMHPKFKDIHAGLSQSEIVRANLMEQHQIDFLFDVVIPDFQALPGKVRVYKPTGKFGIDELEMSLRAYDMEDTDHELSFFVVDHPALMDKQWVKGLTDFECTTLLYKRMKLICDTFQGRGIVGIFPTQANDEGRKRAEKDKENRYDLGAIAHSHEIEKSCNFVFYVASFNKKINMSNVGTLKIRDGKFPEDFCCQVYPLSNVMREYLPEVVESKKYNISVPSFNLGV